MKLQINLVNSCLIFLFLFSFSKDLKAQQDPQYTQYIYNTMSINPAHAGTRGNFSVFGLHRSQWVGIDGSPKTHVLAIESPLNNKVGLGLNVLNDKSGPAQRFKVDGNFSYTIPTGTKTHLSFGLKAGVHLLDVDFSKGTADQQNDPNLVNIDSKLSPSIGVGLYYHHDTKWFIGASIPNLITTKHYSEQKQNAAQEQLHFFLLAGYTFTLNDNLMFKPAILGKVVSGSPLSTDITANFLYKEKLTLGISYRLEDSISALAGFQITNGLFAGYAYDFTTSRLNGVSSGSHEIMLRYDFIKPEKTIEE